MAKNQEVERIAKKLDKMVQKESTDGALDLLRELQNIKMSLETLQSTRVGMSVNAVRKQSSDEEVQTLAKSLIKSWKRLLDGSEGKSEKKEKKKGGLSCEVIVHLQRLWQQWEKQEIWRHSHNADHSLYPHPPPTDHLLPSRPRHQRQREEQVSRAAGGGFADRR
ncbi:Transcription elongation factor A protein 1 [Oryzias melastigma]|uniref:Transcription elongation factor A protein 1 n=1 Tax=Oryzias melastigma TaxID=30732 RepID=A0A834FQ59_ORYME|nr:Transcription elongation factor A protein 1 [Oryzias melastigma]